MQSLIRSKNKTMQHYLGWHKQKEAFNFRKKNAEQKEKYVKSIKRDLEASGFTLLENTERTWILSVPISKQSINIITRDEAFSTKVIDVKFDFTSGMLYYGTNVDSYIKDIIHRLEKNKFNVVIESKPQNWMRRISLDDDIMHEILSTKWGHKQMHIAYNKTDMFFYFGNEEDCK